MEQLIPDSKQVSGVSHEQTATLDVDPNVEQVGNVVYVEATEKVTSIAAPQEQDAFPEMSSSEPLYVDKEVLDRIMLYKVYQWTSDQNVGDLIAEIDFFKDLLQSSDFTDTVFRVAFLKYLFFLSDLGLYIRVVGTPFHAGSIVAAWYYQAASDDDYKARQNVASMQLLPHVIVYASQSNPGEIFVPFKSVFTFLKTRAAGDKMSNSMGRLRICVLNKLQVPEKASPSLDLMVSFKMMNAKFAGMVSPEMMTQMDPATVAIASSVILGALNRDLPPRYDVPTNVRISHGSLSHGSGEHVSSNRLRMFANAMDPLPGGSMVSGENTLVKNIVQTAGFLRTIVWKESIKSGESLMMIPMRGVPYEWCMTEVPLKTADDKEVMGYVLPPVACVNSMHCYRRGTFVLEFRVVGTFANKGKFMAAYIPSMSGAMPSMKQAFSCVHSVFDIGEQRDFFFRVPYVNNLPWSTLEDNDFRYRHRDIVDPGVVVLYVVNRLTYMESSPKSIDINLYLSGGEDYEVAVPTAPSYALSWNLTDASGKGQDVVWRQRTSSSDSFILSNTDSIEDGKVCVLDSFEGIWVNIDLEFDYPKNDVYTPPYVKTGEKYDFKWHVTYVRTDGKEDNIAYFVPYPKHRNVFLGVKDLATGQKYIASPKNEYLLSYNKNSIQIANVVEKFQYLVRWGVDPPVTETQMPAPDVRASRDQQQMNNQTLGATGAGLRFFGESFSDLKNICRRYQHYASMSLAIPDTWKPGQALFGIPVLPQGLAIDDLMDPVSIQCREGIIPFITSLWRHFRGGVDFMLILEEEGSSYNQASNVYFVEHRPDFLYIDNRILNATDLMGSRPYHSSGFASEILYTRMNNILEFHVPYYNVGRAMLLQEPRTSSASSVRDFHRSLGVVLVGCYEKPSRLQVTIKYRLGDDFEFGTFVGAPPMVPLSDFQPDGMQKRLRESRQQRWFTQMQTQYAPVETVINTASSVVSACSSLYGAVKLAKVAGKAADVIEGITEKTSELSGKVLDVFEEMLSADGDMESDTLFDRVMSQLKKLGLVITTEIVNLVSQICHCLVNPRAGTIAIAVVTVLMNTGLLTVTFFGKIKELMEKILERCGLFSSRQPQEGEGLSTQADFADFIPQLIGALFLAFNTIVGVSIAPPHRYPNVFANMVDTIRLMSTGANHIVIFIRNMMTAVTKFWEWYEIYRQPEFDVLNVLEADRDTIRLWAKICIVITDPAIYEKVARSPKLVADVFRLSVIGEILSLKAAVDTNESRAGFFLKNMNHKIQALRDRLAAELKNPAARFEPFVLALTGKPNVGKSYLMQELCISLLEQVGYETDDEAFYYRPGNNAYWNMVNHQPILIFDDVLAVKGERGAEQISEVINLKSCAVFNPPKARAEDKDLRYNPIIFGMCMNDPFPRQSEMGCEKAFYRRRDYLYHVQKVPKYLNKNIKEIPREVLDKFEHLEFLRAKDPEDPQTTYESPITYAQLRKVLDEAFSKYYVEELGNYHKRLKNLTRLARKNHLVGEGVDANYQIISQQITAMLNELDSKDEIRKLMESLIPADRFDKGMADEARSQVIFGDLKKDLEGAAERVQEAVGPTNVTQKERGLPDDDLNILPPDFRKKEVAEVDLARIGKYLDTVTSLLKVHLKQKYPSQPLHVALSLKALNTRLGAVLDESIAANGLSDFARPSACPHNLLTPEWNYNSKKFHRLNVMADMEEMEDVDHPDFSCGPNCAMKSVHSLNFWLVWMGSHHTDVLRYYADERFHTVMPYMVRLLLTMPQILDFLHLLPEADDPAETLVPPEIVEKLEVQLTVCERLRQWRDWMMAKMRIIWQKIKDWKLVIGAIGLIATGYELYRRFRGGPGGGEGYRTQYTSSGDQKTRTFNKPSAKIIIENVAGGFRTQSSCSRVDTVVALIQRNTFELVLHNTTNGRQESVRCLGLAANYAIVLSHYVKYFSHRLKEFPEKYELHYRPTSGVAFPLVLADLVYFGESTSDIWVLVLPKTRIPAFRSLWGHIATHGDHSSVSATCELITVDATRTTSRQLSVKQFSGTSASVAGVPGDSVNIHGGFEYAFGGAGLCGSVLICPTMQRPIVGIHVAGLGNRSGAAEHVYREMFAKVVPIFGDQMRKLPAKPGEVKDSGSAEGCNTRPFPTTSSEFGEAPSESWDGYYRVVKDEVLPEVLFDNPGWDSGRRRLASLAAQSGSFEYVGLLSDPYVIHQPNTTNIRPSDLEPAELGLEQSFSKPAHLSSRGSGYTGECGPLFMGIRHKFTPPRSVIDQALFDDVVQDYTSTVCAKMVPIRAKVGVLGMSEAITGFPGIPEYRHIELSTSEGFPMALFRPKGAYNKAWLIRMDLFNEGYELHSIHHLLAELYVGKMKLRMEGIVPFSPYLCCTKDERLPLAKADKPGSTRIIDACPVDLLITLRQFYLDFIASFQRNRMELSHAVGVNQNSLEWGEMVARLRVSGENVLCGDYSKFGPRLIRQFVMAAFHIMNRWYEFNGEKSEHLKKIRRILFFENVDSIYIAAEHVFRAYCGSPSGSPLTVIINSIVNILYVKYALRKMFYGVRYRELHFDRVRFVVYGDDIMIFVNDEQVKLLNNRTLSEFFAREMDIKYTHALKGEEMIESEGIETSQFLKCQFAVSEIEGREIVLAPLDWKSVNDIPLWGKKRRPLNQEEQIELCMAFLNLVFHHGPQKYRKYHQILRQFWARREIEFSWKTFNEIAQEYYFNQ